MNEDIDLIIKEWAVKAGKRKAITPKYIKRTLLGSFHDIDLCVAIEISPYIEIDDYTYESGVYAIGGAYVPEVGFDFELTLTFSEADIANGFPVDQAWVDEFALEVAQVSIHENRHREQVEARDVDFVTTAYRHASNSDQAYLGNYDEVDAYGIAIAYQLKEKFGINKALDLMRYQHTFGCGDLDNYYKAFDIDHEVIRRLFKKVATHLINYR